MTAIEHELLEALVALERAMPGRGSGEGRPDLAAAMRRVDELSARVPESVDSQLRHYLQRKSFQKAREWLEHRSARGGTGGA